MKHLTNAKIETAVTPDGAAVSAEKEPNGPASDCAEEAQLSAEQTAGEDRGGDRRGGEVESRFEPCNNSADLIQSDKMV